MQIDDYLLQYEWFCRDHNIDISAEARAAKLFIEVDEFGQALISGTPEQADSEALDVMNVAIANVVARGICNPLFAGYRKLVETSAKYKQRGKP